MNKNRRIREEIETTGTIQDEKGCSEAYLPTIEEKLVRMEYEANQSITYAKEQLAKVERIRKALKSNPALSDIYTLLKF